MKIENLKSEKNDSLARVAATVIWEDCDRPPQEIYFETPQEFAEDISCNPHAFLIASLIPAQRQGEKRVWIDAEICPELQDGLMTVMSFLSHWYKERQIVKIEAKTQSHFLSSPTSKRAAFFFSGGIDSLGTLRNNRLQYPLDHPNSIKDGLLIYGLEFDEPEISRARITNALTEIAEDAGVTLIPVYTNVRHLNDDWKFWVRQFQGAALCSVAHILSQRLNLVYLAASDDIPNLKPLGSHPLIDPNYSTNGLRIQHDGIRLSRLEKTRLIADWEVALQNFKVCFRTRQSKPEILNCGHCEKCLRTMLALVALEKLDKTRAFYQNNVSEEDLLRGAYISPSLEDDYGELIPLLKEKGRNDLVRGIHRIIKRGREQDFRGFINKVDRKLFQGNLINFSKKILTSKI